MSSKARSRPPAYPRVSFHVVRAFAFICATIVSGILIYFFAQLRHDGFKLPWTLLIVLAAALLSLVTLIVSTIVYTCFFLSPLFNLVVNIIILLIWTVGAAMLTYNMYGALGHSCSRANWATDDGIMVCQVYKALYSFVIFGWLSQIALIVLDVRSRRAQTKLGRYDKMADTNHVKMDSLSLLGNKNAPPAADTGHAYTDSHASSRNVPYGITDYRDESPRRGPRPGLTQPGSSYSSQADYAYPSTHGPQVRMDDFDRHAPPSGYGYANNGYGYGPQR